jgi:hypothetical protein
VTAPVGIAVVLPRRTLSFRLALPWLAELKPTDPNPYKEPCT